MMQSRWPIRAVMLDPARQTESFEFYERLIPDLARWGYNTLILHIADDQGCAIMLDSPRVLPTAGALTIGQWRALADLAGEHGIEVVPEVECLGHTGYITRLPEYASLREPPPQGGYFWSACPVLPATLEVVAEVLTNVAAALPGRFLHIGMDEADIGGSEWTRAAVKERPLWRIFGDYALELTRIARNLGRRPLMWGDQLLKSAELMEMIPRDVIVCNWLYGRGHREDYRATTQQLLDAGFDVLGCPAGCWHGTLFVPHADNLANIADFDATCRSLGSPAILGMALTMWCSYRHLPAAGGPIMAFAARRFGGEAAAFGQVTRDFVTAHYGLQGRTAELAGGAIASLHEARTRTMLEFHLLTGEADRLAAETPSIQGLMELCAGAVEALRSAQQSVKSHPAEFDQWVFTAEFLRDLCELRLDESRSGQISSTAARARLAGRYFDYVHRLRPYLGTRAEEPALGQAPLFWPVEDEDNPAEQLDTWKS